MGSYTMTLKECMDLWTQNAPSSLNEKIEMGRQELFNFDYPFFDEDYKAVFETHFIRKFLMREIGFETEGLFKFNLETWLSIHMPYYNKLFESELIQFDPLSNTKMETKQNRKRDSEQNQSSKTDGTNTGKTNQSANGTLSDDNFDRQISSDTPDGRLNLTANDGQGVIEYANNIKENTENNKKQSSSTSNATNEDQTNVNTTGNTKINDLEDYLETKFGKAGNDSFSKMLQEYRQSLIRVEQQIFEEMQELFMLVY